MERAFRRSLVLASLAHAALALALAMLRAKDDGARVSAPAPVEVAPATETFVVLDEDVETLLAGEPATTPTQTETSTPPPMPAPMSISSPTTTATTTMVGIVQSPGIEPIPVPPIEAPTAKTPAPFDPLAKFEPNGKSWVTPLGAGAKLGEPPTAIDTKAKEQALAAKVSKDVSALVDANASTGSNFSGPVVSAAHDAATSPMAPDVGIAVFVVRTDAAGSVTSVSVRDVSSDLPGWAAVGKTLQAALAAKKLVVPTGANGVQVTVKLSAKYALPSGANPKKPIDASLGGTPFGPGIGGTFDLADIGSKPMRVVAVVVLDEGRL